MKPFVAPSATIHRLRPVLLSAALGALAFASVEAHAQVGHNPTESPYEDIRMGQNLSLNLGWLGVRRDPANVAPLSALFGSLRYDVPVGGPAALYVRYSFAPSERRLLLPSNPQATRLLSTPRVNTSIADVGIDVALTGRKTWRRLSPSITGGAGLVSDFTPADTGGYRFGTKFAFSYGFALRYVLPSGIAFRADLTNFTWQYSYPDRYFAPASDSTSVLTNTRQRSAYRANWGLSGGITMPIFR